MMIVDDVHEVAFVHIPKCGGTSVSRQLRSLDSNKEFFKDVRDHPALGRTHFSHLPLFSLREFYPETFDRIAAYRAFAIARDPYVRFASSTIQHLDEFRGFDRVGITTPVALTEARRIVDWLSRRDRFSDAEYMHFTRQSDYVELDGRMIVRNIFPLENVAELATALEEACGVELDPDRRDNTSFSSDSAVLRALRAARPLYSRLTTWTLRRDLLLLARRLGIQKPSPFYDAVRQDPEVSAFVEEYYARDFSLYAQARARIVMRHGVEPAVWPLIKGAERPESELRHAH